MSSSSKERLWTKDFLLDTGINFLVYLIYYLLMVIIAVIAKNDLNTTTFELQDGTLYISLKRMESKGLIESYWQSSTGAGNRRKYYKITDLGRETLDIKVQEWNFVKNIMDEYLRGRN